jgi:hypothetical protein
MEKQPQTDPGRLTRWRHWRQRRKLAARERRAWAEERIDKERYRYRGGGDGPSGGDGGGGL